jgi:hypothetical protein
LQAQRTGFRARRRQLTIVFPPADLAAVKVAAVFALNFDA